MEKQRTYRPDRWVVLKIDYAHPENDPIFRVFASWAGGYADGDSWRLNSGIVNIEEDDDYYFFHGHSESCYQCRKGNYGVIATSNKSVLERLKHSNKEVTVKTLPEDTDWKEILEKP